MGYKLLVYNKNLSTIKSLIKKISCGEHRLKHVLTKVNLSLLLPLHGKFAGKISTAPLNIHVKETLLL